MAVLQGHVRKIPCRTNRTSELSRLRFRVRAISDSWTVRFAIDEAGCNENETGCLLVNGEAAGGGQPSVHAKKRKWGEKKAQV